MPNKDEVDAVAKAAAEVIKEVPIYKDALQPVAQEVGKALKTVGGLVNMALAPVALMVYGYDLIKQDLQTKLEKRLSTIPQENIITPPLQIVGPLLDRYKYVFDKEDISQMFVNLLANAMDKERVKRAHPSFVNIISELSPDEAKLIKIIAKEEVLPKIDLQLKFKKTEANPNPGFEYIFINFTLLGEKGTLDYPELTPSYLSNLERLNIISCPIAQDVFYSKEGHYKPLEEHSIIKKLRKETADKGVIEIKRGIIRITDFGELFLGAVLEPGEFSVDKVTIEG